VYCQLFWLPTSLPGSRQSERELLLRPGAKPKRKFGVRNRAADDSSHSPFSAPSALSAPPASVFRNACHMHRRTADVMNFRHSSLLIFQVTAENSNQKGYFFSSLSFKLLT